MPQKDTSSNTPLESEKRCTWDDIASSPVLVSNSLNKISTILRLVEKIDVTSAAQRDLVVTGFAMVAI